MKILATSDIHIGRRPTGLPADLAREYSAANTWQDIVERAKSEKVEAVIIAGDVVDESNKYYEALSALQSGLEALAETGIKTYAVVGNHDAGVLENLAADSNIALHILGRGGKWEKETLEDKAGNTIQLVGWSFPQAQVNNSPIADLANTEILSDKAALGIIHCDIDNQQSQYCPVTLAELTDTPLDIWLTGHIHKPELKNTRKSPWVINLGTPQGLDPGPGESGSHGPWFLEYSKGRWNKRFIPSARLVYKETELDLTGVSSEEALQQRLTEGVREAIGELRQQDDTNLETLVLRLIFIGNTGISEGIINRECHNLSETPFTLDGVQIIVNAWRNSTMPSPDLKELAKEDSILGSIANLILELQGEREQSASTQTLIKETESEIDNIARHRTFSLLKTDEGSEVDEAAPSPAAAETVSLDCARRLLSHL
ncbi:MAG: metallophosphoesterase family protein, partial [Lentisphaeria bacterium]